MAVVGIDPAKTCVGLAVLRADGTAVQAWSHPLPEHGSGRRLDAIVAQLGSIRFQHHPDVIAVEGNRYSASVLPSKRTACGAAYDHGAIAALVDLACDRIWPTTQVWWVTPAEWASLVGLKRVSHRDVPKAPERRKLTLERTCDLAEQLGFVLPRSASGARDVDAAAAALIARAAWAKMRE